MSIYPSGTIINNRYEVVQGPNEKPSLAGGMGLVYLCVDHAEDGKPVALKTFRPELLSDRAARDRFLREGTTWVELGKHPHIVRCHRVFKVDVGSEVLFALELVAAAEGKKDASLRSWLIPNEPLPLEQALLFALYICRGMLHATNKIPGLVHRDLKPENILIGRDGRARITDFGLASAAQNLGSDWQLDDNASSSHIRTQLTHGIAGTPLYMAPEQWAGEPLDERADIYAFGCILYEMVCGSFVVTGSSVEELKEAHCQGRLRDIPTELNEQLCSLLQRCVALNRADRHLDWMELEKEIAEICHIISGEKVPQIKEEFKDSRNERISVGWSYNEMGLSYIDLGKFGMARHYFEKVQTIAQKEKDLKLEVAALGNQGSVYFRSGDPHRAIEFLRQCLTIVSKTGDRLGKKTILGNLGNAYFRLCDFRRAIEFYEKWLYIAREIGDRHGEGQALGNLGEAYRLLSEPRRAIEFNEQHLAIAREIGDRHGEGQALGSLGNAHFQLGNPYIAIEFLEKWLFITREIGDRHGEGQALGNLGTAYHQLGDPHQAIKFHEQCLAIARETGDRHDEGSALGNLGVAYHRIGDSQRSIELLEQRLAIAREIGDRYGEGQALGGLGNVHFKLGDPRRAIEFYEKWLSIALEIGDRHGEGQALGNLGNACFQLDDPKRAIKFYKQRLAVSREIGDIIGAALTSFNMASILKQDHLSEALRYANEALHIFNQVGHKQYADQTRELIDKIKGA